MTTKHKRLAYVAGAFGFIVFVGWNLVASPTAGTVSSVAPPSSIAPPPVGSSPSPTTPSGLEAQPLAGEVDYAIAVPELSGLTPDAAPGSLLDLWVTWDPPITEGPQVQRLLRSVRLTRIVAPVTPDGPTVAVLAIRHSQVSDLIFGDRYGTLSVTMLAETG